MSELYIVNEAKDDSELPIALETLDRGGLTFPKKQLLPYLQETEHRILEFLTDKRYGCRLFEVHMHSDTL